MSDRKLIHQLADGEFAGVAHNAVLVGGPGTGKTHLATAIGVDKLVIRAFSYRRIAINSATTRCPPHCFQVSRALSSASRSLLQGDFCASA